MCAHTHTHNLHLKWYPTQNNLQCILYFELPISKSFPHLPSASLMFSNSSYCSYPPLKSLPLNSIELNNSLISNCLVFDLFQTDFKLLLFHLHSRTWHILGVSIKNYFLIRRTMKYLGCPFQFSGFSKLAKSFPVIERCSTVHVK